MVTHGPPTPRVFTRARSYARPVPLIVSSVFASILLPMIDIIDRAAMLLKWPALRL